jgi:uncharacterized membrane protein YkoI
MTPPRGGLLEFPPDYQENFMCRFMGWSGTAVLVGLVMVASTTRADEEKISVDKLPQSVVAAVKARFPGAELKSAEKEKEDGKTIYDVSLKQNGGNYEVAVTPEGEITGYEKEIAAKDMPKDASKAIEDKYPGATLKLIEEVYKVKGKTEKLEYYEVALVTADKKKLEVHVASDGKILKGEEEGKKGN